MSVEIKRIVEESKSPKELLDKLDKIDHRLSNEELEMVTGGENTGKDGCTGGGRPSRDVLAALTTPRKENYCIVVYRVFPAVEAYVNNLLFSC